MMRELEQLIRYIHANPSAKIKPLIGWVADLGQNSVYLRRPKHGILPGGSKMIGTRYVLSTWPESKSQWSATFRMDTLSLMRQEAVTIEDLEIENKDAFDRDMIFFKMVLADES